LLKAPIVSSVELKCETMEDI
jgi:hypothetical protein